MAHDPYSNNKQLWVGNHERTESHLTWLHQRGVKSARFGIVAYDIDGKPLPQSYAPVLIDRVEADQYNDVMMSNTFGEHWKQLR